SLHACPELGRGEPFDAGAEQPSAVVGGADTDLIAAATLPQTVPRQVELPRGVGRILEQRGVGGFRRRRYGQRRLVARVTLERSLHRASSSPNLLDPADPLRVDQDA